MPKIRGQFLATTAVLAIMAGLGSKASAEAVMVDPGATLTVGSPSTSFVLDSGQGAFAAAGGSGLAFEKTLFSDPMAFTKTSLGDVTYNGDMVVEINGFNSGANGINSGWQLFAVISIGGTDASFDASTDTLSVAGTDASNVSVQLYAVQGDPATFATPKNDAFLADSSSTEPQSVLGSAGANSLGVTGLVGPGGTASKNNTDPACIDGSTTAISNGTAPKTSPTNCILLADGSSTTGSSLSITGTGANTTDVETFNIITSLSPESYAEPFFDTVGPLTLDLSIDAVAPFDVSDPNRTYTADGDGVTWQINPVPEPASISLFGAALIGLGAALRRRQRRG